MRDKPKKFTSCRNEKGSALLLCILMLFVLTVLGISSITTTDLDMNIAANEKFYTMAFTLADGGAETAKEIVEQAIDERIWEKTVEEGSALMMGSVKIWNKDFWKNEPLEEVGDKKVPPTDTHRDVQIPLTINGETSNTNLLFGSFTDFLTGGALQMVAGYEGIGKSLASGGSRIDYGILSRHTGVRNTESRILVGWRHVM